jgi:hypothetical protein
MEIGKTFYETLAFNGISKKICMVYARQLTRICDVWAFNRQVDLNHISTIENDLKIQENPNLMGTIKLIIDKNKEYKIIDGQHRLQAIRNIIRDDHTMEWDMPILTEIYDVSESTDEITNYLYTKANVNLNIRTEDVLDDFLIELIQKMMNDPILKNGIVDKQDGSVYKPRISKKDLYEKFKVNYKHKPSDTVEELFTRIKEKNMSLSSKTLIELFGKQDEKNETKYDKAFKIKFFLNLDCKYSIDKWIQELNS